MNEYLIGDHGRGHWGTCAKWEAVPIRYPSKTYRFELRWNDEKPCTCVGAPGPKASG